MLDLAVFRVDQIHEELLLRDCLAEILCGEEIALLNRIFTDIVGLTFSYIIDSDGIELFHELNRVGVGCITRRPVLDERGIVRLQHG